jgi:hypothetical protein
MKKIFSFSIKMDLTSRNVIALAALEECEHLNMKYRERFNAADAFELSDRKFVKMPIQIEK